MRDSFNPCTSHTSSYALLSGALAATLLQVLRLPAGSLQLVDVDSTEYTGVVARRARPPRAGGGQFGGADGRGSITYVEADAGAGDGKYRTSRQRFCTRVRTFDTMSISPLRHVHQQ